MNVSSKIRMNNEDQTSIRTHEFAADMQVHLEIGNTYGTGAEITAAANGASSRQQATFATWLATISGGPVWMEGFKYMPLATEEETEQGYRSFDGYELVRRRTEVALGTEEREAYHDMLRRRSELQQEVADLVRRIAVAKEKLGETEASA
jgi:hypothetical protein